MPYLDKLTFEFGQDPTVAVLRLKKGEVDIVGDGIPPAQFAEIMADPANKDLIADRRPAPHRLCHDERQRSRLSTI